MIKPLLKKFVIFSCFLLALGQRQGFAQVQAQVPYLVKDVGVNSTGLSLSSNPSGFIEFNGFTYFSAADASHGFELWKTDGTEVGTMLVKDIEPGRLGGSPSNFFISNNALYFLASTSANGFELWKTDGTEAGTVLVKEINPGAESGVAAGFAVMSNLIYFMASNGITGAELWKSDGTESGTVIVKDINPGSGGSFPRKIFALNGVLYFTADNGTNGTELWKSDGTEAGTVMVKDINQGSGWSSPDKMIVMNDILYFMADNGTNGEELWKTDGTEVGTALVKDINTGPDEYSGSAYNTMRKVVIKDNIMYFTAEDGINGEELWRSDGTEAGTYMVKDISPGDWGSSIDHLTNVNGTLFFSARDGSNGAELWKSDGTASGTVMIKDINSTPLYSSDPNYLTGFNGILYFAAQDVSGNVELWRSDGTEAGTYIVKDLNPSGSGYPKNFIILNNSLYFFASTESVSGLFKTDGTEAGTVFVKKVGLYLGMSLIGNTLFMDGSDGSVGYELWKSDGTTAGTYMIKDIYEGNNGSLPNVLSNINGTLFYRALTAEHGFELWTSDGTETGTYMVKDIKPGTQDGSVSNIYNLNGTGVFFANDGVNGMELWKTDGTEAGTVLVKDLSPGSKSTDFYYAAVVGNTLIFGANTPDYGYELWKTDGTTDGTVLVKDIRSGTSSSYTRYITAVNGYAFFNADNGTQGQEIWRTDGTTSGTILLKNIKSGFGGSNPFALTAVGNELYFIADGSSGGEVWKSDGSEAGTVKVKSINADFYSMETDNFVLYNGIVYFKANDDINGLELWRSDGTESGTYMLKDINPGAANSEPGNMTVFKGYLYFTANNGTNGYEIWRTDGTEAGTVMFKDINPGSATGGGAYMTVIGDFMYFNADDGVHGEELWKTDGTEAGTEMLQEFIPGAMGSPPGIYTNVNGKLFFRIVQATVDNFDYGDELWSMGDCTPTNTLATKLKRTLGFNSQLQSSSPTTTCHCDVFNNLVSKVDAVGANPISGKFASKSWIEPTAPSGFVKRHYEINPATDSTTATGKVTLYFTQAEFDAYNAGLSGSAPTLPANSTDATGIANLMIEKRSGHSFNNSGLPNSYAGAKSIIDPIDTDIVWNSTASRWEVSFETTGFGGFFAKTLVLTAPTVAVSSTNICSGTSITLTATCDLGTLTWYNQATGGTAIGTVSPLVQNPTATTTYSAECTYAANTSDRTATSEVVVTASPSGATGVAASSTLICSGGSVNLTATCATGTVTWYNQATGGTAIGTGSPLSQSPTAAITYYASCKNGNCESSRVGTSQLTIITNPTNVSVNSTSICSGSAVSLTATCATGTISWYNQATGGTAIGTGSPLSQSPTVTTTYYAVCSNGTCETTRVGTSQVAVVSSPTGVAAGSASICTGASVSLTATCAAGSVNWYNVATGGASIGTGSVLSQSPTVATTYYAVCSNGTCESARVATGQVAIVTNPNAVSVSNTTICKGSSVALTASCAVGTLRWYNVATGGTAIGTGSPLSQSPTVATTYYAVCTNGTCETARVATSAVSVTSPTASITANKVAICKGDSAILTGQCTTLTDVFRWNTATLTMSNALASSSVRTVKEPGVYKAVCESVSGCVSAEASVTISGGTGCGAQSFIVITPAKPVICPTKSVTLSASGCTGTVSWTGGAGTQTGTSNTVTPSVTTTYTATCSVGGSATVTVTVSTSAVVVAANITTGAELVKAVNTIESAKKIGDVSVTPGANVKFEAGKSVLLKSGFVVEKGSTFFAEIKGCS